MKKSLTPLGETEMEILHIVWDLGKATVAQVQERILEHRKVAYTTIMTVMRNLNRKGYLVYTKKGAAFVYEPAPGRSAEEVKGNLVNNILTKVFHGSPAELVQSLVQREDISEEERKAIISKIKKMK